MTVLTSSLPSKERRRRLFWKSRPLVRPYEPKDNGFLWAAYQNGALDLPRELTQEQFLVAIGQRYGDFPHIWIVEDDSKQFRAGRGQIALVAMKTDGWTYEPQSLFFPWATKRNVVRACVAFFQMMRYQKEVGCCLVKADKPQTKLLNRMQKYGVLYPRGRIPLGSPRGDVWVFSITGKKADAA